MSTPTSALALSNLAMVALGGAGGSVTRYLITIASQSLVGQRLPWGTLACNLLGCFAAGVMIHLAADRTALPAHLRLLIMTGFLGGLTTFSSFAFETIQLARAGEPAWAIANTIASVVLSLAAAVAGLLLASAMLAR